MHIHHKIKPENMNFKGILIEIGTIIFAVLLALGAEGWWEHHKTLEMVDMSTERINKEITNNLYEFVQTQKGSTQKLSKLISLENEIKNSIPFSAIVKKFDGYDAVNANNSTWKRVLNDKTAAYFPIDYVEDAFGLYSRLEALEIEKESLVHFIFSDLYLNKDKEKEAFEISKIYYSELLRHCKEATKSHKAFLKKYDEKNYNQVIAKCDSITAAVK